VSPLAERAVTVWPLLVAQTLLFGTSAFVLGVAPRVAAERASVQRRLATLWRVLAILLLVASPLALLSETASMAAVPWGRAAAFVPEVLRGTHLGLIWTWRLPVTAAVLVVAWRRTGEAWQPAALGFLGAGLLVFSGLSGHAVDYGTIAVAVYCVHEMAAALWLGAVLGLWLGAGKAAIAPAWTARTVPRVSRVAGWCVGVLVLTGAYNAYDGLGLSLDTLLYSAYGRTLLWKIVVSGAALAGGGYNRYALMPALARPSTRRSLRRALAVECALLIAVLGVTALLANTPPAHHH
jgi:copper resistance protein D